MLVRIKNQLLRLGKEDIIKVFSFTAISTLVRMLTGLISVKIVSTIIGPAGIALLGQLNNFTSIVMTGACGGINSGVTKYVAEHKENPSMTQRLISTAFRINICCSFLIGIIILFFHTYFSTLILNTPNYGYIFILFGSTLFLYALNMLLASILNGFKEFKRFVKVNISGSILGLLFTLSLVFSLGLKGAMISAVTFQSVMFFVSIYMVRKLPWLTKSYFKQKFDCEIAKRYFKYTLMTFVSAATIPVSQLILRSYVISEISPIQAGWWEAMNRLSNVYLMVVTSSFGVYYLPRLSELSTRKELRSEIFKAYKLILPILLVGLLLIYLFRIFIIRTLFSDDFLPMNQLFAWQLIGDFLKIFSWLLSYLMLAKSMTKTYIVTEIVFASLFVLLGFIFIHISGIVGLTQAYTLLQFLYCITMLSIFRKIVF